MQILLPGEVKKIIGILEEKGYEAYAVGGCVRDSILGREPDDWDITTSANPYQVKELFKRTVDTGLQHGTVTVLMNGEGYEVTTYRIDGEYEDGRHPREVVFTASLQEDLKRRDFTINAMAYSESQGLVDAFGGMEDLERGIIRCVGEPRERFSEDALRILRAVRFGAQLGFEIHHRTKEAVRELAENLSLVSAERIQVEMIKLLCSPHPEYLRTAWELGITQVVIPEFDAMMDTAQNTPHHDLSVGEHTLKALGHIRSEKVQRLSVLLHDVGKPMVRSTDEEGRDHFYGHGDVSMEMAGEILRRWRMDNETLRRVTKLVRYHDLRYSLTDRSVRRMVNRVGQEVFLPLLEVQRADILAQSEYRRTEKLETLRQVRGLYQKILERQECLCLKDLAVTGRDLIQDGMAPGPQLGQVLDRLLEHVLEEPQHNTKEYLVDYARQLRGV